MDLFNCAGIQPAADGIACSLFLFIKPEQPEDVLTSRFLAELHAIHSFLYLSIKGCDARSASKG